MSLLCGGGPSRRHRGGTRFLPAPRLGSWPPKKGESDRQAGCTEHVCTHVHCAWGSASGCLVLSRWSCLLSGGGARRPPCAPLVVWRVRALCVLSVCACVRGPSQGRVLAGVAAPMGAHARVYP